MLREHGVKVLTVREILAFGVEEHIGARVDLEARRRCCAALRAARFLPPSLSPSRPPPAAAQQTGWLSPSSLHSVPFSLPPSLTIHRPPKPTPKPTQTPNPQPPNPQEMAMDALTYEMETGFKVEDLEAADRCVVPLCCRWD